MTKQIGIIPIHGHPIVCGIYKITSPSNKIYIGQSINCWWRKYLYTRLSCKKQPRLYNSFKKYGFENHIFEIIHVCEPFELNELEVYYIELYQTFNTKHGMNLRAGGKQNAVMAEESKKKISDKNRGRVVGSIGRSNMSAGSRASEIKPRKKVYQFDLEGKLLNSFKCARVAAEELKLNITGIRDCCKKYQPTAYGFFWSYEPVFLKNTTIAKCRQCGDEFEKEINHNRIFCSHKCWNENYKVEKAEFIKERSAIKYQKRKAKLKNTNKS